MEEIKAILESLVSNCLRASNADDEEKKDEKAENKKTPLKQRVFLLLNIFIIQRIR